MLHPRQFRVNETWIVSQLNDTPIPTEQEGDFNLVVLIDAASLFLLSSVLAPATETELTTSEAVRLLEQGKAHKQQLPKKLLVPTSMSADLLADEARRQGIVVLRVSEGQLNPFVSEAREYFGERFGGHGVR